MGPRSDFARATWCSGRGPTTPRSDHVRRARFNTVHCAPDRCAVHHRGSGLALRVRRLPSPAMLFIAHVKNDPLRSFARRILFAAILTVLATTSSAAAGEGAPLVVGTHPIAPFVIKNPDGTFGGVSIDIWKRV